MPHALSNTELVFQTKSVVRPLLKNFQFFSKVKMTAQPSVDKVIKRLGVFPKTCPTISINGKNVLDIRLDETNQIRLKGPVAGRKHHLKTVAEKVIQFIDSYDCEISPSQETE